jgi:membrane protein DedA with SNARE-associated domain/membrane-associated phospholipid phosphatase
MSITDTVITFAGEHPILIGVAIAFSAFLEAIPFVGSLFPGSTTVLLLSGAVGAAGGQIWTLVIWGSGGGFVGDILAYWFGRRYGLTLREIWPFATRPGLWESVANIFQRHGGKSVVISRFLPGARAVTPIAAGALRMGPAFFIVTSIVAALAWALVYVVPAAILGQLLSTAGQISARLVGAVLTVIIALALAVWLARFAAAVAGPRIYRGYRKLIGRMERSSSPLARRIGALLDPALATIGAHLLWGTVLLVSAIGLFGIVQGILASAELVDIDSSIRTFARSLRSAPVDTVMVTISAFGEGWVIATAAALLVLALLVGGARLTAAIVASVFGATFIFLPAIAAIMLKEYPVSDIHPGLLTASFPSSHATLVTLFCGIAAALATPALGAVGRTAAWSLALAVATLVGLSQIYLDALWPSDVAGGLLLGLALTAVFAMIRTGFESELGRTLRYPLFACLVLLAFGSARAALYHDADIARYAPRAENIALAETHWLADGWRDVPFRRQDIVGESEETISLQVAADPALLAAVLSDSGWKPAPPFGWRDLVLFLSPATPLTMLPPLPLMEGGRWPSATFVHTGPTESHRLVIRLWTTDFSVSFHDRVQPIFIGSITGEEIVRPYDALTMLDTLPSGSASESLLGDIVRDAGTRLSVLERRGPAGSVLLIAPYRGPAAVSAISVRPALALMLENRAQGLGSKGNRDSAASGEGFLVESIDNQIRRPERALHPGDHKIDDGAIDHELPIGKKLGEDAPQEIVLGLGKLDAMGGA